MSTCEGKSCQTCSSKEKSSKEELLKCKLSRIKHKFIVMSGKGGVGKSSVAVYLALGLASKGHQVGLLDIDLHGPSVPKMLGLHGLLRVTPNEEIVPHEYLPNLKVVSIESLLEDTDSAVIWRGPLKHGVIQQFITECQWNDLDYLIVDCPPGTGDEPLSIARMIPDAQAVIVTTPQEVALSDVRKSISFCKKVQLPIAGLVENMSGLYCPHCNEFIPIFRTGGGKKTAEQMKIRFLGSLPFDPAVVEGGDKGEPVLEREGVADGFREAVGRLIDQLVETSQADASAAQQQSSTIH